MRKKAQGATEYLVLLAVVLVIALVGIALLGFFPGTASDTQLQESEIYWKSASPIAITEWGARSRGGANQFTDMYIRLRNTGAYPIRIIRMLGNGQSVSQVYTPAVVDISSLYYMAPGEESYFAITGPWDVPAPRQVDIYQGSSGSAGHLLYAASTVCANTTPWGYLQIRDFGFEYIQYVEGQQSMKREIGTKPLFIRCKEPYQ